MRGSSFSLVLLLVALVVTAFIPPRHNNNNLIMASAAADSYKEKINNITTEGHGCVGLHCLVADDVKGAADHLFLAENPHGYPSRMLLSNKYSVAQPVLKPDKQAVEQCSALKNDLYTSCLNRINQEAKIMGCDIRNRVTYPPYCKK